MCLLNSCCCCFSLTVGTHLICLLYMGFYSYCALFEDMYRTPEILQWYVYCGLFSSICGWIGLRWEKKGFVSIMFLYDSSVAVMRAGMIYMYHTYPRNPNLINRLDVAQNQLCVLIVQIFFLWVQLSYIYENKPATVFQPVPQSVIVTSVPVATSFPIEYQTQLPYSTQPSFPVPISVNASLPTVVSQNPSYPSHYAHLYPSTAYPNEANETMGTQSNHQPFPYDAPPPYSETKTFPAAPSAPSL